MLAVPYGEKGDLLQRCEMGNRYCCCLVVAGCPAHAATLSWRRCVVLCLVRPHAEMKEWLDAGKLVVEETVFSGIDQWPAAFQSLFTGTNSGKVVLKL